MVLQNCHCNVPVCALQWPLGVAVSPPLAASSLSGTPPWPGVKGQRSGIYVYSIYQGLHHSVHM